MSWQEATVALFGTLLVIVIVSVLIWQIFKTGQVAISSDAQKEISAEYRQSLEGIAVVQKETSDQLAELTMSINDLQKRVIHVEQMLTEVE